MTFFKHILYISLLTGQEAQLYHSLLVELSELTGFGSLDMNKKYTFFRFDRIPRIF